METSSHPAANRRARRARPDRGQSGPAGRGFFGEPKRPWLPGAVTAPAPTSAPEPDSPAGAGAARDASAAPGGPGPRVQATAPQAWSARHEPVAMDPWLVIAAVGLLTLGLVMVYSASAWLGHEVHRDWSYFLVRQGTFAAVGVASMRDLGVDDDIVNVNGGAPHAMALALVLLVAVLFTQEINGARRWLRAGPVHVQPSEIGKIALTIFLSSLLARQGERVRTFQLGFLPIMLVSGLTMVLVLAERDLGTTILLGALTLTLLYVAGTRLVYVAAAVMVAAPVVWSQIVGVAYRRARLEEFLASGGYQVKQALISIGSGGAFGLGLGNGRQKLGFLPENHTDFILATIGEELGLAGIVLVLALVALLVWRGLVAARHAPDRFGTYLAVGLSFLFGMQALVNMAVVLDVIPAKGITLPMLSYGGSSLVTSMGAVGLLLSISRRPRPWRWSDQRAARRDGRRARGRATARSEQGQRPANRRRRAAAPA